MKATMKNGYHYDFASNTITMTKAFEKKSAVFGSDECNIIMGLRALYPDMKFENYESAPRTNTTIPYSMMATYISLMPNGEKNLKELERIKQMSKCQKSPYKYVYSWFGSNYPNYKEVLKFDENNKVLLDTDTLMQKAEEQTNEDVEISFPVAS